MDTNKIKVGVTAACLASVALAMGAGVAAAKPTNIPLPQQACTHGGAGIDIANDHGAPIYCTIK